MTNPTADEISGIAEEAYVFAFPMLMGYRFVFASFLVPHLPTYRGPLNELHGKAVTLDHTFRDVITPNADTPYSLAALDLRAEPIVLEVPPVDDRYYVIQFVDLYGTNPHYVGSRATGPGAGTYLVAGPGWQGSTPDGVDAVLSCETDLVILIGRTQLLGPDDVERADAVMAGYRARPLSAFLGTPAPPAPPAVDWPVWNDEASRDERFIGLVNPLLPLCQPPHPSEVAAFERFARVGIGPGVPFDAEALDSATRDALRAGVATARARLEQRASSLGTVVNGWSAVDALGDREFFAGDYELRAAGAMAGWGGNDTVEAFYPLARVDADDAPLDGAHRYQLTLAEDPPARAFWSVTIYDTSYDGVAGYLVENPIGRYLVNSTTPGLVRGDDASLTITIQRDEPDDPAERANWLPAPEGPFYLVLRVYWPEAAALDGTWTPPSVVRLD